MCFDNSERYQCSCIIHTILDLEKTFLIRNHRSGIFFENILFVKVVQTIEASESVGLLTTRRLDQHYERMHFS